MLCSISVWVLWSAHLVWAKEEGGAGTVGGGERVGAVLRDLRDEGRCTVEFASDFVQHEAPATSAKAVAVTKGVVGCNL